MIKKIKYSNAMEKKIFLIIAAFGFIGALLCLSPNMTGNVIGEISTTSSDLLGIVFLIIGLASVGIVEIND